MWKKSFRGKSIYIQHNLSSNFHPPSLTASQYGAPVLISSESIWQIKSHLNKKEFQTLESYSYSSYESLLEIINRLITDSQYFNDIRDVPTIYSSLSADIISNFVSILKTCTQLSPISSSVVSPEHYNAIRFFEDMQTSLSTEINHHLNRIDIPSFNSIISSALDKYCTQDQSSLFTDYSHKLYRMYGVF